MNPSESEVAFVSSAYEPYGYNNNILTFAGADVFVLAAGGRGRATRRGDGEHRRGGVLRRRQVRGLPKGNAQHGVQDTQEKHTAVHWKLQGEGNRGSSRAMFFHYGLEI